MAKYMGDGVLAYFGYPRAHEDEAERAVRSGLARSSAVASLVASPGRAARPRGSASLPARSVVGDLIGEGAAREAGGGRRDAEPRGAVAGARSAAQRSHQPGDAPAPGRPVRADDLGVHRLKGFAEPLCRLAGRRRGCRKPLRGASSGRLTPLVGREEEIALLLRRWQQARDGEGQVVLLSGEPGIGKSRLVRGLRGRLPDEPTYPAPVPMLALPYRQPAAPVYRAAGARRRLRAERSAATRLDKLEALLRAEPTARGGRAADRGPARGADREALSGP